MLSSNSFRCTTRTTGRSSLTSFPYYVDSSTTYPVVIDDLFVHQKKNPNNCSCSWFSLSAQVCVFFWKGKVENKHRTTQQVPRAICHFGLPKNALCLLLKGGKSGSTYVSFPLEKRFQMGLSEPTSEDIIHSHLTQSKQLKHEISIRHL